MKKSFTMIVSAVFSLALPVGPASAVDCTQPGNLVSNCGFVTDISLWAFTADSATRVAGGASSPGAAALDRHDAIGAIEAISACISFSPSSTYDVGASFRLQSGAVPSPCSLDVWLYSDSTCTTYTTFSTFSFAPSSVWSEINNSITPAAGLASAQFRLACFSASDFVMHVDDFIFRSGFLDAEIFLDGFESGNVSAWSAAVP